MNHNDGRSHPDFTQELPTKLLGNMLAGGIIGIVVGIAGAWSIASFAAWLARIQPRAVIPAFLFAAAVGVFFGLHPAGKRSRSSSTPGG